MDKTRFQHLQISFAVRPAQHFQAISGHSQWSKGNLAVADEITDPKMLDRHSGDTGSAGLKQIVTLLRKAFPALKVTINNIVAEGDLVVADVTFDEGVQAAMKHVLNQSRQARRIHDGIERWDMHQRDRPLRDIRRQVAHALQIGIDLQAHDEQAKITGYGLVEG